MRLRKIHSLIVLTLLGALPSASTPKGDNQMQFYPDTSYPNLATTDPKVYTGTHGAVIDAGSSVSPGFFVGGRPGPMVLLGTWGPASLYTWTEYIKRGHLAPVDAQAYNLFGLPNGIAMINWKTNNLIPGLDGKFSLEMITGWGSYPKKEIENDYGWINGIIMNLNGRRQAPFIHIDYRKITGTNAKGDEESTLYFWELLLDDTMVDQAELLYHQLKEHIDKYWNALTGTVYPQYTSKDVPQPLASVIDSVYLLIAPSNQQIPTVPAEKWSANTAFPANNFLK